NLASVWNLPVLFICTNNTYGMSTPIAKVMKNTDISKRAIPFDMPSESIDGNDILKVYDTVKKARRYVLKNGPMLIVENTYRISGHSKSDGNLYRTKDEINAWKEKCPIKRFREYLITEGIFTEEEVDKMVKQAEKDIEDAVAFAKASPEPKVEDVYDDVFA
ncbi:MAG: pyruvate dehydrogenase, partial [Eubacterium sp.]|nr:pyruvate dehydrogenase [Eubacterium sp.]